MTDVMMELERTFLAKYLPDLEGCEKVEIKDIYVPAEMRHPVIRIRKKGRNYMMTKKEPEDDDASAQNEYTIPLTEREFGAFEEVDGKVLVKVRYYKNWNGKTAEIDVFKGKLAGLVLVDFEFESEEQKKNFEPPEFCLADVTQEEFIAGGMLCGKSYEDISNKLEKWNYEPIKQ
ncbi:MAG: adenylate cyclase [Candidatus Aenigmatarchaeota archaeon]